MTIREDNKKSFEVAHINIRQSISILIIRIIVLEVIMTSLLLFSCGVFVCQINPLFFQLSIIAFAILKIALVVYLILQWLTEYYEIMPEYIVHRRGIIFIKETRHPLEYVREVGFDQSFLGKLLNYGTIRIFNWQTKKFHTMYLIHNPKRYFTIINKLIPDTEKYKKFIR